MILLCVGCGGAADLDPLASLEVSAVLGVEVYPGLPPIPPDLQALIRRMVCGNPPWGEEWIAEELLLKLGLQVSPR
jgi:hypothetical protein